MLTSFDGDLDDSNSRHLKKIKTFECLMNESQCNFGSVCWHYKVSIVEKDFLILKMLLNCWLLTANFFAKSLPLKNVFLSFFELKIEAHLVFLSGILRRIYSAFSLLEVLVVRQLCKEKEATTNFS